MAGFDVVPRILLSPREPLVGGGPAEAFERQLQELLRAGRHDVVVDLTHVEAIDSAGLRALVRGHTSAQRAGRVLRIAGPCARVRDVLDESHLSRAFALYDSLDAARFAALPWRVISIAIAGAALCIGLVLINQRWPDILLGTTGDSSGAGIPGTAAAEGPVAAAHWFHPFIELSKLVVAALVGLLVTAVHQPAPKDRPLGRSMAQAQTLLCVSGAMMMIIIGNSLARAFGIAGAASIIRFKTPVDDPKDVVVLFLLMGIGMSAGLGAFGVVGLGTAFLCIALLALDAVTPQRARVMSVEIAAAGRQFPSTHVERVFAANQVLFEPREISQSDDITVTYHTWVPVTTSIHDLSTQLMTDGITAVAWEHAKRA